MGDFNKGECMATTHIVCILDRSGSMSGSEKEVINSFNKFIKDQKKIEGKAKVTLVLFDNEYEKPWTKIPLKNTPKLTEELYYVRGMTALNDAIGKTINEFSNKKKVIMLIQTDGLENASREFSPQQVKKLIKKKDNWEFVFIGSDLSQQDTSFMSREYGIASSKTMSTNKSSLGFADMTTAYAATSTLYRSGGKVANQAIDINDLKSTETI